MDSLDRRRYFRINDIVSLRYRLFGSDSGNAIMNEASNVQITSARILESLDLELAKSLSFLWKNSPETANVISLLSKKIDVLAGELDLGYIQEKTPQEERLAVNISACGMAFNSKERFDFGQRLDLFISFKSEATNIQVLGTVVACEQSKLDFERPYSLRVDFDGIDLNTQETLIQHIVQRQSSQLSLQRQKGQ